jgi:hypothetical protein
VGLQIGQPEPRISHDTVEFGHHCGLRQGRQLGQRSLPSIGTQCFAVIGRISHRVRNQCLHALALERQQFFSCPAVTCHQLRFAHESPFEMHTGFWTFQYL